jgi:2-dehydro-3-deoxyphosphogluconate aldolase/(4S)-4-hydroxy-2-oxoglutarate aldolase
MKKVQKLDVIRETGVIAIMRAQSSGQLITAAEAIQQGGVRVIEVTMTTPGALDVIAQAVQKFGDDVLFGAGSVLDAETARAAILAGAGFIVSPTLKIELIALARRYSVPVLPGCYTPTEMLTAWEAGADMVKLFPASVGGPDLVHALLAPLPQLEIEHRRRFYPQRRCRVRRGQQPDQPKTAGCGRYGGTHAAGGAFYRRGQERPGEHLASTTQGDTRSIL